MKKKSTVFYLMSAMFVVTIISELYWDGAISYYYMNNLGLSIKNGEIVWSIFSVYMIFTGLLCGKNSDRNTGTRMGRRLPYLRFFGPLAGIAFSISFLPDFFNPSQLFLSIRLLLVLCIIDASCEFLYACLFAIPSEEIRDENERINIYMMGSIVGAVGAIVAIGGMTFFQPEKGEDGTVFSILMMILGIAIAIVIFFVSKKLPNTYHPDEQAIHNLSYVDSFKQCLSDKHFLIGEVYLTACIIATTFITFGFFYYVDECLESFYDIVYYAPGLLLGIIFPILYSKRKIAKIGLKRVVSYSGLVCSFCLLFMFFFHTTAIGRFVGSFGIGIIFIVQYLFNQLLLIEFVDKAEEKYGVRKEGEYFGLDSVFDLAAVVSQPVFLFVITQFGYRETAGAGAQSTLAQEGIVVAWLLIPAVIFLTGTIIMLLFYPEREQ